MKGLIWKAGVMPAYVPGVTLPVRTLGFMFPNSPAQRTFGNIDLVYWEPGPESIPALPRESHRQFFLENGRECMWQVSHFWLWLCPFLHHCWNASSVPSRQTLFIKYEPCHYFGVSTLILLDSIVLLEVFQGSSGVHGSADMPSHPSSSEAAMLQSHIHAGNPHSLKKSHWSKWQYQHEYGFI